MIKRSIGTRYARALFELARDVNALGAVEKDFPEVVKLLKDEPGLERFLTHPAISGGEKKALVERLFKGRINVVLFDFVNLVIDKKREGYLVVMGEEFGALLMEHQGRRTAKIYTAFALESGTKESLAAGLSRVTGRKVEIEEEIDPGLIGGITVRIGDKVYDGSISDRLADIRGELSAVKV